MRLRRLTPFTILLTVLLAGNLRAQDSVRQGPRPIKAGEVGVGSQIPDHEFVDVNGNKGKLSDYSDARLLVIAFTGTSCPLNLKFGPTLADLEKEYSAKGVKFLFSDPTVSDTDESIREAIELHGFKGAYVPDRDRQLAAALSAQTTTEAFVLDAKRTLLYRGAVDDQYGLGYSRNSARVTYLRDALDATLAGDTPKVAATWAPGCELDLEPRRELTDITYHNRSLAHHSDPMCPVSP